MLTATRTTTPDQLRALRNYHPTHAELVDFFAGLASCLKHNETALGEDCKAFLIDQCDECMGQVENDKIEQQTDQDWASKSLRELDSCWPLPAELDALTIRRVGV